MPLRSSAPCYTFPCVLAALWAAGCSGESGSPGALDHKKPSEEAWTAIQNLQAAEPFVKHLTQARPLVFAADGTISISSPASARRALEAKLPNDSHEPLRLSLRGRPGFWAELTPKDHESEPVRAELVENTLVFPLAGPDTDVLYMAEPGRVEELRVLRSEQAPSESVYRVRTGPDVHRVRVREGRIELLDAKGRSELSSAAPYAIDRRGMKRFLSVTVSGQIPGDVYLHLSLDTRGMEYPVVVDPAWYMIPPMSEMRTQHQAVLLADGRVLVSGGTTGLNSGIKTAEIYDPVTNTWSMAAPMVFPRKLHTLTLLPSGKVLAAGGYDNFVVNSAEIYDPVMNKWAQTASFQGRDDHLAYLLQSGKVLVLWGGSSTPQLYDETTGQWTNLPNSTYSYIANAAMMKDEKMFIVPFSDQHWSYVYDPMTGMTTQKSDTPGVVRSQSAGVATNGGKVAFVSGYTSMGSMWIPDVLVWDSATDKWGFLGLSQGRTSLTATLLPDDTVLVAGGESGGLSIYANAELLNPNANSAMPLPNMLMPRENHTATLLKTGQVLLAGGVTDTAEIYGEPDIGKSCGTAGECLTGNCVDGVCCDTVCTGQCEACDVMGQEGTCVPVVGAPHGGKAPCATGASVCQNASCDGVEVNTCAGLAGGDVECAPGFCNMGGYLEPSFCNGQGQCVAGASMDCGGFACVDGMGCRVDCTLPEHCLTGFSCTGGVCVMGGGAGGGGSGSGGSGSGSGGMSPGSGGMGMGENPAEPGGCCGVARSGKLGGWPAMLVFGLGMGVLGGRRRRRG